MPVTITEQQLLDVLRSDGVIDAGAVARIAEEADRTGVPAVDILKRDRLATEEAVAAARSKILNIPFQDLSGKVISDDLMNLVPRNVAETFKLAPISAEDHTLVVGLVNPSDYRAIEAIDFIAQQNGYAVSYRIVTENGWRFAMRSYESEHKEVAQVVEMARAKLTPSSEVEKVKGEEEGENIESVVKGAPVSRIVSVMFKAAVDQNASDIHIEPYGNVSRVRFRIDGILRTAITLPLFMHAAIISRVKVLANLKLDETRIPQDGRIRMEVSGHPVDFRVSTLPVVDFEKVVMRILSADAAVPTLEALGFRAEHVEVIKNEIRRPHGLFLVSGPTGSGKSTTLYTVLSMRNEEGVNIITLEDPIEYYLKGANQSQIRPEINYSFATGLRSILRQDPNIIMVGEIRDSETAELSVHAALTGHLIFSTIHTNDALGVTPRLIDLGVEPFLLSATLNVAIAQRLGRRVCQHCRAEIEVTPEAREFVSKELARIPKKFMTGRDPAAIKLYRGAGCTHCAMSGYIGRIAVCEVMMVTDNMRKIIESGFPNEEAKKESAAQEMLTIKQDGILKALDGFTTIEEIMRITRE
jgi:type IV pilus assembly protein PilB